MSGDQLMRQDATNDNIINPDLELNLGIYLYIYVFHLSDLSSNLKVINGHTNQMTIHIFPIKHGTNSRFILMSLTFLTATQ